MRISRFTFKEQECIVYFDSYVKTGDGVVDAYIDFRTRKDYELFRKIVNLPENAGTYIELRSLKSSKRLIRGCYYKFNLDLLKKETFNRVEGSLIIGGSYNLSKMEMPDGDDTEILQKHEILEPRELRHTNVPQEHPMYISATDDMTLFVKDVNQANWNELRSGNKVVVLYDAGARLNAKRAEVDSIFESRKADLETSKPMLVISHWDIDHIHCLKLITENELPKYFSKLICVDKKQSMTALSIYDKFIRALGKKNVYCLPPATRTNGIDMHLWKEMGCLSIYQGEKSRNINYCGIVMFVKGLKKSANYTGDCRLTQAKNVYDQEISQGLNTTKHALVAPHHGGDYGVSFRLYSLPCNEIAISVGYNNHYGHPQRDMERYLNRLGIVKRTDVVGDIEIML